MSSSEQDNVPGHGYVRSAALCLYIGGLHAMCSSVVDTVVYLRFAISSITASMSRSPVLNCGS